MKDLTVKCSNKNCNKEYVSEFKKCPFCGTKNPLYDDDGLKLNEDDGSEKSSWYVFSNLVLIGFCYFIFNKYRIQYSFKNSRIVYRRTNIFCFRSFFMCNSSIVS